MRIASMTDNLNAERDSGGQDQVGIRAAAADRGYCGLLLPERQRHGLRVMRCLAGIVAGSW